MSHSLVLLCALAIGGEQPTLNELAESYVKLVLAFGQHDADYVDAYYGPDEWKAAAVAAKQPLADIRAQAERVLASLTAFAVGTGAEELLQLRHAYLVRQLQSLIARCDMLLGKKLSFDEESRALYDAVAPHRDEQHYQKIRDQLSALLPGSGPLVERYDAFRRQFVIPPARLDAVFRAAITRCGELTRRHIELPEQESFTLEYVKDKPWSAYNWYQGKSKSLIQVNTDLPVYIDRAIDLACHEGYPGHHVYQVLLEKELVQRRGWIEYSVYPLFSPQSLISEGSANFGIEVAFPSHERLAFERDVLYPLAGLDPANAEKYEQVQALAEQLAYAQNDAARRYIDGEIDAKGCADWLEQYTLAPRARAEQRVRFIDRYRSYVINYNLGKDLVRDHVAQLGGTAERPDRRWEVFRELLSSPRLPSGLARTKEVSPR
jgi:hypothetical protein